MTDWVKPFPPEELWRRRNTLALIRITEDGRVRMIEGGTHYRVIEYRDVQWRISEKPTNPWT